MSKVVGIHGQDVPAATAGEPREDVVVLAEWLAEAARSGEIIGIHAVFVFRDECTGTKRAGFQRGIIYLTPDYSSGSYLLMQRAIPP